MDTQVVWMTNDIGGRVIVYPEYLYIRFSHSRNRSYRINGKALYELLDSKTGEFEVPGNDQLTFITETLPDGVIDVTIQDVKTRSDKDLAVVCRRDLIEALYFWLF